MAVKFSQQAVLPVVFLTILVLQGCQTSEDGGRDGGRQESPRLSLDAQQDSLAANGSDSTTLTLTVRDASGDPEANAPVTFTLQPGDTPPPANDLGGLSPVGGTAAAATAATAITNATGNTSMTVTTDENGTASVLLTAGTSAGDVDILARSGSFSVGTDITYVSGQPETLVLSVTDEIVDANGSTTVTATVRDANDNPVSGATVAFAISDASPVGSLLPMSATTDGNGQAQVTYEAGGVSGTDDIEAATGADGSITDTITITVILPDMTDAASLELLVSSPQLDSDGSDPVTLTAVVRDANNNLVPGATVSFSADSGGIQITNDTTDDTGTATALLSTAGDPTNRTITVTASVGAHTSTNTVNVAGTTVTLSGTSALVLDETTTLSILLQDSGGDGIGNQTVTISSSLDNDLSSPTVTTDSNGQATFQVTATAEVEETDTITATALGASGTLSLAISLATFEFTTPDPGTEVDINAMPTTITVHWDEDGVAQVGETINFFATRGMLSATSAVTDGNGDASVTITSTNAGPAVITAVAAGGPSSQIEIEFVATNPTSLTLQARPTTLGINAPGTSDQQSTITAIVRDPAGNLVKNQQVSFTLDDVSGGSIFPAFAITDSFGRASTVYTAGAASSAQDGVLIDAEVAGTGACTPTDPIPSGPCDRVTLTVAQQALFVILGTGNLIEPLSPTQYAKPYSVLVTDANSNPIEGATVELNIYPTRYEKGFYTLAFDDETCVGWAKFQTVTAASMMPHDDNEDQACDNEDVNRNGFLDDIGEDTNNNGTLEPGNIAAAPTNITTDATGFAFFDIEYAREFTWVEIELEARATVFGSEGFSTATFFLPGLAADFDNCDVAPPGQTSPYGVATTCSCDELTGPMCPTLSSFSPVTISGNVNLPAGGGTLTFTVAGGAEMSYSVSTTAGTLENLTSGDTGSSIQVNFEEDFTLTTTAAHDEETITLTAVDNDTGQSGTAIITQAEPPPISPVTISPDEDMLPADGGTLFFTVEGGTETSYTVETDFGTLENLTSGQTGDSIQVNFGGNFSLMTTGAQAGETITLTAADNDTDQTGTATITQAEPEPL